MSTRKCCSSSAVLYLKATSAWFGNLGVAESPDYQIIYLLMQMELSQRPGSIPHSWLSFKSTSFFPSGGRFGVPEFRLNCFEIFFVPLSIKALNGNLSTSVTLCFICRHVHFIMIICWSDCSTPTACVCTIQMCYLTGSVQFVDLFQSVHVL